MPRQVPRVYPVLLFCFLYLGLRLQVLLFVATSEWAVASSVSGSASKALACLLEWPLALEDFTLQRILVAWIPFGLQCSAVNRRRYCRETPRAEMDSLRSLRTVLRTTRGLTRRFPRSRDRVRALDLAPGALPHRLRALSREGSGVLPPGAARQAGLPGIIPVARSTSSPLLVGLERPRLLPTARRLLAVDVGAAGPERPGDSD